MESVEEGVEQLFDYNRENFFFDQEQNIKREYQEQDMRVKKFVLYREDVRDLMQLTTGKMDSYILPVVFLIWLCFLFLVHGDIDSPRPCPDWLLWLYVINLTESFLYLFLSAWFVVHASVSAHSFGVRLLTQFVRLPVPNRQQLDAARRYAAEFEAEGISGLLRVPLWKQQMERLKKQKFERINDETRSSLERLNAEAEVSAAGSREDDFEMVNDMEAAAGVGDISLRGLGEAAGASSSSPPDVSELADSSDPADRGDGFLAQQSAVGNMQSLSPVLSLKHVRLYRELQANWQAHDAYARCCMALGTYTLTQAAAYYTLGLFAVELDAIGPALGCAINMVCLGWLLVKLDIWFRTYRFVFFTMTMISGPILAVGAVVLARHGNSYSDWHLPLVPVIYLLNALLIVAIAYIAHAESVTTEENANTNVALPTRFRTVLYLDVFGWMGDGQNDDDSMASGSPPNSPRMSRRNSRSRSADTVLPEDVRNQLCVECQAMASEILTELHAWETEGVQRNCAAIPGMGSRIRQFRQEYDKIARELADVGSTASTRTPQSSPSSLEKYSSIQSFQLVEDREESPSSLLSRGRMLSRVSESSQHFGSQPSQQFESQPSQRTLWVSLKWTCSDSVVEYFVHPETGEACSDLPEDALVSDSDILAEHLAILAEHVETLKTSAPPSPPPEQRRLRTPSFNLGIFKRGRSTSRSSDAQPGDASSDTNSLGGRAVSDDSVMSSSTSGASGLHSWAQPESIPDVASVVSLQPAPVRPCLDRSCSPGSFSMTTTSSRNGGSSGNVSFSSTRSPAGGSWPVALTGSQSSLRPPPSILEQRLARSASPVLSPIHSGRRQSAPAFSSPPGSTFRRRSTNNVTESRRLSLQPVLHEARSSSAATSRQTSPGASFRRVIEEETPSLTQEVQFGGREAAQLQVGGGEAATVDGSNTAAFAHSGSAALTFHPQFHPRRDGRRESKRLPGSVPWTTFLFSSCVLVSVWLVGFFFYAYQPLSRTNHKKKLATTNLSAEASLDEESTASLLTGGHVFLSAQQWSGHSVHVQPVGFTCTHDGLAFVAEQYRVHQIRLDTPTRRHVGQRTQLSSSVERCLSQQPEFHSSGLASISLECSSRRDDCTAILLGVHGRHVLYCPLATLDAGSNSRSSGAPPRSSEPQGIAPLIRLEESLTTLTGFLHGAHGSRRWWGSATLGQQRSRQPLQLQVQFGARSGPRAFPLNDISDQSQSSVPIETARLQPVEPSAIFLGAAVNRSLQVESPSTASADSVQSKQLGIASLHLHDQTGLLALTKSGKMLHAWAVTPRHRSDRKRNPARAPSQQELTPLGSWRFPEGSRWSGICTSNNYLYALGHTPARDRQDPGFDTSDRGLPEIWRFDLPESISNLDGMADAFV